ncbi:MAG: O-antigen ligase family protein [Acetobacteraceae bacterium]|nr:O-antigen ligase family protein [Acetobacteraceae bacterium]
MLAALDRHGTRVALVAALALPLLVIVSRSAAEAVFAGLAAGFLLRLARLRWSGAALPTLPAWFLAACGYWVWLVLGTLANGAPAERLFAALAWGRFPLALLAVSSWLLVSEDARRWALRVTGASAAFVALETWAQFALGRGVTGSGRALPGYLSGPFTRPRVGAYLGQVMWPALLAATVTLRRGGAAAAAGAVLLIALGLGAVLLSGQRGAGVTAFVVLLLAGLLLPALRRPALGALAAAALLAAAAPVVAPDTFDRYAAQLPRLIATFPETHYGQILARALAIHEASPWLGHGAEAFRHLCREPAYLVGWGGIGDGGGAAICVPHPHNHYLEALLDGGWPGLLLFSLFQGLLAVAILRGLLAAPREPVRVGLALPLLLGLWPVATAGAYAGIEGAAPRTLMTGWALAAARPPTSSA